MKVSKSRLRKIIKEEVQKDSRIQELFGLFGKKKEPQTQAAPAPEPEPEPEPERVDPFEEAMAMDDRYGPEDMAKFKSDLAMIDLYNSAWINNEYEKPNANTIMSLYLKLKEAHPNIASVIDDLIKEKNGDPRNPKKTFSVFDDYPLYKIGKEMKKVGLSIADRSYLKGTQWNYSGPDFK